MEDKDIAEINASALGLLPQVNGFLVQDCIDEETS